MAHLFFVQIPHLLFEPIAVMSLLGCLVALVLYRKKHQCFFGIVFSALFVMLSWRLCAYRVMASSRYNAILLYPSLIFSAWLCFQFEEHSQWLINKIPTLRFLSKKSWRGISWFLIAVLSFTCLCKTLRYDSYQNHIEKICKVLARESRGKEIIVYTQKEVYRVAYYAKIDVQMIRLYNDKSNCSAHELIKKQLLFSKNFLPELYLIFYLRKGEPEPDAQALKLDPSIGKWEYLHREYTSKRKNREIVLYRFIPRHPNIDFWEKEIPAISPNNLLVNGDFEAIIQGKELEQRIRHYREIGASDFYTMAGKKFPQVWWLGVPHAHNGRSPEIALTTAETIAGKYSIEINGKGTGLIGMQSGVFPKQDCMFSGFIRAKKNCFVYVLPCFWENGKKAPSCVEQYVFDVSEGKTYRFQIPLKKNDIPKKSKKCFLIVQTSGHVLIDNLEAIPFSGDAVIAPRKE